MKASTVEIVFVIDASTSMKPFFVGLANNLDSFLKPLQGFNFKIRLGLLTLKVARSSDGGSVIYATTLAENDYRTIYQDAKNLFTESPDEFLRSLRDVDLNGEESNLIALDMALDFPFGALSSTRRVVAIFSDEKIEDGAIDASHIQNIPKLIKKLADRRIRLFGAMPTSEALEVLGSADGSQIQVVESGNGLSKLDFEKLLGQIAKSISVTSLQGDESEYERALFGQDQWGIGEGSFEGLA